MIDKTPHIKFSVSVTVDMIRIEGSSRYDDVGKSVMVEYPLGGNTTLAVLQNSIVETIREQFDNLTMSIPYPDLGFPGVNTKEEADRRYVEWNKDRKIKEFLFC